MLVTSLLHSKDDPKANSSQNEALLVRLSARSFDLPLRNETMKDRKHLLAAYIDWTRIGRGWITGKAAKEAHKPKVIKVSHAQLLLKGISCSARLSNRVFLLFSTRISSLSSLNDIYYSGPYIVVRYGCNLESLTVFSQHLGTLVGSRLALVSVACCIHPLPLIRTLLTTALLSLQSPKYFYKRIWDLF